VGICSRQHFQNEILAKKGENIGINCLVLFTGLTDLDHEDQ
jgi:hypothetical protein